MSSIQVASLLYTQFCRENNLQQDLDIDIMIKYITLTKSQKIELLFIKALCEVED